jgi:hypothetical protein
MNFKRVLLLMLAIGVLSAQKATWRIDEISVRPGDPPLKPITCTESDSGYGHVHFGERTKLTSAEIGQYVVESTQNGSIVTLYPEDSHGWFVSSVCPKR